MRAEGQLDDEALAGLEAEVADLLAEAVAAAEQGPLEPVEELTRFVTSPDGRGPEGLA